MNGQKRHFRLFYHDKISRSDAFFAETREEFNEKLEKARQRFGRKGVLEVDIFGFTTVGSMKKSNEVLWLRTAAKLNHDNPLVADAARAELEAMRRERVNA